MPVSARGIFSMSKMISKKAFGLVLSLGCLAFAAGTASGQILRVFTVNTTSDTVVANACTSALPGCSLRGAIQASNPNGDAIIGFNLSPSDPGCSTGVCAINLGSALPTLSSSNVTIAGPGADRLFIRPANGVSVPIITVNNSSGPVRISGVTIRDGRSTGAPAAGIDKLGAGSLELSHVSVISNINSGLGPGGIRVGGGQVSLLNSAVVLNQSLGGSGAGMVVLGGNPFVTRITNSTFLRNQAALDGGALTIAGALDISHSTFVENRANGNGGGIQRLDGATAGTRVKSSIIANNECPNATDIHGFFQSFGYNLIGKEEGGFGFTLATDLKGSNASPLDPKMGRTGINGGGTPTVALRADSPAIDKGASTSTSSEVLPSDQRGGFFARVSDDPLIPNASQSNGTDIGAYERNIAAPFDFDRDHKSDIGIFRPSDATWWINRSSTGVTFAAQFGLPGDTITPGDFTGDGKTDIAVWRPSNGFWIVLRSEDFSFFAVPFGTVGDIPVPADFDNDGRVDTAVFRPSNSTWFIQHSGLGLQIEQFGTNGDVPVPADYDGDGRADIAIYRPSNGQWWLSRSTSGVLAVTFGVSTDKPVPGDFTGDGKVDIAVWRPSTGEWFVLRSENLTFFGFPFGAFGDVPAPGDYDGDGRFDATVFRPSNSVWFSNRTTAGVLIQQFGSNGDRPVANAFVP
jgi:CSLREA domain-containing protein